MSLTGQARENVRPASKANTGALTGHDVDIVDALGGDLRVLGDEARHLL